MTRNVAARPRVALVARLLVLAAMVSALQAAPAHAMTYDPERNIGGNCVIRALEPLHSSGKVWGRYRFTGCGRRIVDVATAFQQSDGQYATWTPVYIDPSENTVMYALPKAATCRRHASAYKHGSTWYRGPSMSPC